MTRRQRIQVTTGSGSLPLRVHARRHPAPEAAMVPHGTRGLRPSVARCAGHPPRTGRCARSRVPQRSRRSTRRDRSPRAGGNGYPQRVTRAATWQRSQRATPGVRPSLPTSGVTHTEGREAHRSRRRLRRYSPFATVVSRERQSCVKSCPAAALFLCRLRRGQEVLEHPHFVSRFDGRHCHALAIRMHGNRTAHALGQSNRSRRSAAQ